jgi:pimeloyl-ACP methyl ester carboxylesterase
VKTWLPAVLALLAAPATAGTDCDLPAGSWSRIQVPETGRYYLRYLPTTLDRTVPAPLILFLHGAGASPELYQGLVAEAAEAARTVVVMPRSSGLGWGSAADAVTLGEALRETGEALALDETRFAVAGHSAGGAFAYLLAYAEPRWSAVFTLAASFYPVFALSDPAYVPPIRMYYSTGDPNYTTAYPLLKAQWAALGVPWQEDVQAGFSHGSWPDSSLAAGFQFLVAQRRPQPASGCLTGPDVHCLSHERFRVEVTWEAGGTTGKGQTAATATADSGLFWFFNADNWELLVKVLDGCAVNNRYWVFAAATTDVRYVLTVTDTKTGQSKRYENPAGVAAQAIADSDALGGCGPPL